MEAYRLTRKDGASGIDGVTAADYEVNLEANLLDLLAGLQAIQRAPSGDRPPPGAMTWTWGWWVSAEPQVCSTAVRPNRAPRCFGSAARVVSVSAAVLNRRS